MNQTLYDPKVKFALMLGEVTLKIQQMPFEIF